MISTGRTFTTRHLTTSRNLCKARRYSNTTKPSKPLVLQCDASEKGLDASLLQDGKPIAYASRALTCTEINYAQIEKELLVIVFGVERFHQYTYGRKVVVDSDHKPLETIFGKSIATAPRRLQKMFMRLQRYDLDIHYKKGSEMYLGGYAQQTLQWG